MIGVDVVALAVKSAKADRADHRHNFGGQQCVDQPQVHILNLPHPAQIARGVPHLFHIDGAIVHAADARRLDVLLKQRPHNAFVHQPAQDHLHHIHIRLAGHPQTVEKLGFQAQLGLHIRNGLAAAVDNHRALAIGLQGLHRFGQAI